VNRKQTVLEILAEVCGVDADSIRPEDELFAKLGVDSPKALHLLIKLEDRFDIEIDDADVEGMKTVADVLDAVARYEAAAS